MTNSEESSGESADTRTRILRAAASAIAERGWGSVRTRDVAERAGVNNALIHYYFGTRQTLLRSAAIDAIVRELHVPGEMLARAPTIADALAGMVGWLRVYSAASEGARLFAEAMIEATRDEPLRAALGEAAAGLRTALAARLAAENATPSGLAAEDAAIVLAAALDGLLLHYLLDTALDIDRAAAALAALVGGRSARPGGSDERNG